MDQQTSGLHLWYAAKCDSEAIAVAATIKFATTADAAANDGAYMEPELRPSALIQSDDPLLPEQPHYSGINLYEAWELEGGSPGVVDAVAANLAGVAPDVALDVFVGHVEARVEDLSGQGSRGNVFATRSYRHGARTWTKTPGEPLLRRHPP